MKINEVEACVGITKKNIRFYESQGLFTPRRNNENGYRDYSEHDVEVLKHIKLLRKLGFPIEEIRQMQNGILTVADGMDRHRVVLERESKNIKQSIALCNKLALSATKLEDLDVDIIFEEIAALESGGASFQDRYEKDRQINKQMAIIISALMIFCMVLINGLVIWEMFTFQELPLAMSLIIMGISVGVIMATILVLLMRLKEIAIGEIEQAKRY